MTESKYRYLKQALSQYWRKSGVNTVYVNGLTQTELVEKMRQISGFDDFPSESLSRARDGHRLLTDYQIDRFCLAMDLTEEERKRLHFAAAQDRCNDYGYEVNLSGLPVVINLLISNVQRVGEVAEDGAWVPAVNLLQSVYDAFPELSNGEVPTIIMRILSMAELERDKLLAQVPKDARLESGYTLRLSWDVLEKAKLLDIAKALSATKLETRMWQARYLRGVDTAEIAVQEGLTEETVLSVLESWKRRLFQRLTEDPANS